MMTWRMVLVFVRRRELGSAEHKGRHAQVLKVVQFVGEPRDVAYPVTVTVVERPDVQLIENGVFVPLRIHRFLVIVFQSHRAALPPESLGRALQYSYIAHALRRLLALTGQKEVIRLLLRNFRNERDQASDAQLRDEPTDRRDHITLVSLL